MPLHMNAIIKRNKEERLLAEIFGKSLQDADRATGSEDKQHIHLRTDIRDMKTGDCVGQIVYTTKVKKEEKTLQLLDADIILANHRPTALQFLEQLPQSSDANEYYDVQTADTEQHLQIETVNRYAIHEQIEQTQRNVWISAFPFALTVYKDVDEMNKALGFGKPIKVGQTEMEVHGLSDTFMAPGNAMSPDTDEIYSFVVGTVRSFRDVRVRIGKQRLTFVVVQVRTALGEIPVAMSRKVFDLKKLRVGCVINMKADIKANLQAPEASDHTA